MLQAQTSPTTGKLHTLGGANENDPTRFEVSQLEDSHCAFSFRHSELKPSHYTAEEKMESLSNNRHPSLPSTEVTVKTEANIQTALGTDLPSQSHLMQQQFHGQTAVKSSGSRICNFSHPSPDTVVADGDGASPPDHGQPTETTEGDAKVDCAAIVAAAPAEDGYSWRKYGQKQVKHSEYPRSYYKCTHPNCVVKKKVERSHQGHVTEIIYKGTHNHAKPLASRRPPGDTQMDHASPDGSNPHAASGGQPNVEARPLWHNGVVVQDRRVEGVEATSFPSVPGELSDSAASMQVDDGSAARRFESPEGVDATSAVSDEVERDDGGTHATMPQAAADGKSDELERKRRKLESCAAIEMSTASRAVREPRVVIQTTSEFDILDDGYRWRKYGQKVVKGNPNPRFVSSFRISQSSMDFDLRLPVSLCARRVQELLQVYASGVLGAEARGARVARPQVRDHHVRGEAQPRGPRGEEQRPPGIGGARRRRWRGVRGGVVAAPFQRRRLPKAGATFDAGQPDEAAVRALRPAPDGQLPVPERPRGVVGAAEHTVAGRAQRRGRAQFPDVGAAGAPAVPSPAGRRHGRAHGPQGRG
ncbi:hypothetical protein GUJ93_ZPchr0014g46921 [Zizania palustris]|uniref:WRKY domain-containing protein n=1 Tax=Zizania palustris TaxID=103762 RepID=A0A8J5VRZ9_ZIZPA|nr:hypothetical protein GUJ93_ZPchr0014g46921 [Zizania palustris]